MQPVVIRMGRRGTTLAVTAASVIGSVAITVLIFRSIGAELPMVGWVATLATPLLLAPTISWVMVGFLFRIHTLEQEMRQLATYDGLTSLYNRAPFLVCCEQYLTLARRAKRPMAILFLDIDHFKSINDTHGHEIGDSTIRTVAQLVRAHLRSSDVAGRMGGEEFVVALPDTDQAGALKVAEKIREVIAQTDIATSKGALRCTVSAGLSVYHHYSDRGIDALLSEADQALYESKRAGRNRTTVHQPDGGPLRPAPATIGARGLRTHP